MTPQKYNELVEFILKNHSWHNGIKGRGIKYIRPHFDTRTGEYYGVKFDGLNPAEFFVVNENRHRDLFDWVMGWLNEGEKS
jgi:hypothetical protein